MNPTIYLKYLSVYRPILLGLSLMLGSLGLAAAPLKIVLVGDSTVTDNAGWGLGFKQFLTAEATCVNTAQGGRSSLSFRMEGRWTNALGLHGDYYLIQFGHNNEPGKPGRSTDLPTYVSNLVSYVEEARAAGAQPVLVTPLTRRQWDKDHPGRIKSSLAPYAEEMRKLAVERHVPLIDLQARSIALCESLGPEKCLMFSPVKGVENGHTNYDGTHLNEAGHVLFAKLVVEELRQAVPALAPVLRTEPLTEHPVSEEAAYDAVVATDGSGTYTTVQAALEATPAPGGKPFRILIKPGIYHGPWLVPKDKAPVQLMGEETDNTVLTWPYNVNEKNTNWDYPFNPGLAVGGNDFRAENLTIQNTSGDHGQALATRVDGDRAVFKHCRIIGWQDTVMLNDGRHYFTNCYVAGRVDFIYGSATAVFDHCEIHSRNGGHVTAASTPKERAYGFVFLDCRLTGDTNAWVDPATGTKSKKTGKASLGRPWRPYASVAYIRCEIGDHISPKGWNNWGKVENEQTARYAEYLSSGPGGNRENRVAWAHQLSETEASAFTVAQIFGGVNGWHPLP